MKSNFKKKIGARILSEANDLKRTIPTLSSELHLDKDVIQRVVKGLASSEEVYNVIERMGKTYPIDHYSLYLLQDDCENGVKFMSAAESKASARIFDRLDHNGKYTPYFEYRDTAMSRLSPFKPEWVKELRVVNDNNPENPNVTYNNGHLLHQLTFYVGQVNVYWKIDGKKYCAEMNTGDSSYCTPWWPHAFAKRNSSQDAYIIAITFSSDVSRSLKEIYSLGEKTRYFHLNYRNYPSAITQLIKQHLKNENITPEILRSQSKKLNLNIDEDELFDESTQKSIETLKKLASLLNVEVSDLLIPEYKPEDEHPIKYKSETDSYFYPNSENPHYKIYPLVRTSKMPLMKGFNIEVYSEHRAQKANFSSSLHSYVYNYSNHKAKLHWKNQKGKEHSKEINPGDSVYLQPFVEHSFLKHGLDTPKLCILRVSGSINLSTQRELSYFQSINRVIKEDNQWF